MKARILLYAAALVTFSMVGITVWNGVAHRVFGQSSSNSVSETESNMRVNPTSILQTANTNDQMADHAFFDMLFNTVLSMEKAAEKLESEGKSGDIWSKFFERRGNLDESRTLQLKQAAKRFEQEMATVQTRAMQIITERRASRLSGKSLAPSDELKSLQATRDAIALRHGERLKNKFGKDVIDSLRESLQQNPNDLEMPVDADRQQLINQAQRLRNESSLPPVVQIKGGQNNE